MSAFSLLFLLFSSFPLFASESQSKPRLFNVLLELNEPREGGITSDNMRHIAQLSQCGYEVVNILGSPNPDQLRSKLNPYKPMRSDEFFFVEGHGAFFKNGKMETKARGAATDKKDGFYVGEDHEEKMMPAEKFLSVIEEFAPSANVHMDVCFAGACKAQGKLQLSLSSADYQPSFSYNPATELLIDLLCSKQGNCKKWQAVDRDGDGQITDFEFKSYLKRTSSRTSRTKILFSHVFSGNEVVEKKQFVAHCENVAGQLKATPSRIEVKVTYTDPLSGKTVTTSGKEFYELVGGIYDDRIFDKLENVVELIGRRIERMAKRRKEDPALPLTITQYKVESAGIEKEWTEYLCLRDEAEITFHRGPGKDGATVTPKMGMSLRAENCRYVPNRKFRGRSGLQGREKSEGPYHGSSVAK